MGIIIASVYLFFNFTIIPNPTSTITITDTANKNKSSGGTDIRIICVKINKQEIPFDSFDQLGNWEFRDGVLMVVNPSEPATLTYQAEYASHIEINFQKHDGSGIVSISENGNVLGELDLYSPNWNSIYFSKNLGHIPVFNNLWKFLIALSYVEALLFLLPYSWISFKKYPYRKACKVVVAFFIAVFFSLIIYYPTSKISLIYYGALSSTFLISCIGLFELLHQKPNFKKVNSVLIDTLWMLIVSIYIYFITSTINQSLKTTSYLYAVGNIFIYLTLSLIIYILTCRVMVTISFITIVSYLFASANYFVNLFRGMPITPGDFLSTDAAATIFTNYKYTIPMEMAFSAWILFMLLFTSFYLFAMKKVTRTNSLHCALPCTVLLGIILGGSFYNPLLNLWELDENIKQYGLAVSFIADLRNIHIEKPYGYSSKDSDQYISDFIEPATEHSEFQPNIIAIMNESFSDLSIFSDQLDNSKFLSNFYSLQNNVVRGNMLVSPFGGRTVNTEYEFLTGNSMAFLSGTVPYQQFILRKGTYSIAQLLKARGYHTIGIHPYYKKGYSRFKVYPLLGFDDFLDIDSFSDPELVRNLYPSDQDSYEKVIEQYEQNQSFDKPLFIFNVTMQNHGGYETDAFGDDTIQIPSYEGLFPKVEEYLTLVKKSDDAFPTLINYFSSVKEPTILVFFGDHQPALETEFYEAMIGEPFSEWSLETWQKQYTVPFLIWANFDISSKSNVFTSANYLSELLFETAGMKLTPYQDFLKYVQEQIPAINGNGFLDNEGIWHSNTETMDVLSEYWNLQYRNMFDKKVHY